MEDVLAQYVLAPHEVVGEFLALSVIEASFTPGTRISLEVNGCDAVIVDTGRGMQMSHAELGMTTVHPVQAPDNVLQSLLSELVWGERGSLGPALANRNCVTLQYTSRRSDGNHWTQHFRYGAPVTQPMMIRETADRGTRIALTTRTAIDVATVQSLVCKLRIATDMQITFPE